MNLQRVVETQDAELLRLRRENRELREELVEWRRTGAERDARAQELGRVSAVRVWSRLPASPARLLLYLIDRAPRICRKDELATVHEGHTGREVEDKIVDVFICRIRATLAELEHADAISTHWGLGYSIAVDMAAALTAAIEAGRPVLPAPPADAPPLATDRQEGRRPSIRHDKAAVPVQRRLERRCSSCCGTALTRLPALPRAPIERSPRSGVN
jgi:DNA-binding winged helix-turn-helix (wHTH) protein